MVVNERDCSSDFAVCCLLAMLNEVIANHVTDCQRPIFISLLLDHSVQLIEERSAQGDSKTCNLMFSHGAQAVVQSDRQDENRKGDIAALDHDCIEAPRTITIIYIYCQVSDR